MTVHEPTRASFDLDSPAPCVSGPGTHPGLLCQCRDHNPDFPHTRLELASSLLSDWLRERDQPDPGYRSRTDWRFCPLDALETAIAQQLGLSDPHQQVPVLAGFTRSGLRLRDALAAMHTLDALRDAPVS